MLSVCSQITHHTRSLSFLYHDKTCLSLHEQTLHLSMNNGSCWAGEEESEKTEGRGWRRQGVRLTYKHNPALLVFMVQHPVLRFAFWNCIYMFVCVCVCVYIYIYIFICTVTCMGEPIIGIAVEAAVFEDIVGQSQNIKWHYSLWDRAAWVRTTC